MCLIIIKEKGGTVPFDKLEIACRINKHGYGYAYVREGKFVGEKKAGGDYENDPQEIADILDKLTDEKVYLHLRHATVGSVCIENAHPFTVLSKEEDGVDLGFMHNGTLPRDFHPDGDKEKSDTRYFKEELARPLALSMAAFYGPKKVITQDLWSRVMNEFALSGVFVFFDSEGNEFIVNKNKGKEFPGWWASNSYSFHQGHYRSGSGSSYGGNAGKSDAGSGYPKTAFSQSFRGSKGKVEEEFEWFIPVEGSKSTPSTALREFLDSHGGEGADPFELAIGYEQEEIKVQVNSLFVEIKSAKKAKNTIGDIVSKYTEAGTTRHRFFDLAKANNWTEVERLDEKQLLGFIQDYPMAMREMIIDLLAERRSLSEQVRALKT